MKLLSGKDASMFTAKLWKQPKCPSIHKWIKKIRYTHTHIYYSQEIMPFVTIWMNLESTMLSEMKDKSYMTAVSPTYGIFKS